MQQDTFQRTCLQAGHQSKDIDCVCIHPDCSLSRFLCIKCVRDGNHDHGKTKNSYILDRDEFYEKFTNEINKKQDSEIKQNQGLNNSISQLRLLITEIQNQLNELLNVIHQIEVGPQKIDNQYFLQELLKIKSNGFTQLSEQDFNHFLNLHKNQRVDVNLLHQKGQENKGMGFLSDPKFQIRQQFARISQLLNNRISCYRQIYVYTAAISNDMKYIISGGEARTLKIWDYESLQEIKEIKFNDWLSVSKFTNDSKILFVSDRGGFVHQLDVTDEFKFIDKTEIHTDWVNNIVLVDNSTIVKSNDAFTLFLLVKLQGILDLELLEKTGILSKQQLFKIQAHNYSIYGLDYHFNQNVIVSGSVCQNIKLWNGQDGSLILEKENAHNNYRDIEQALFVQNNNQLISLTAIDTIIWNINYESKQLEQINIIKGKCHNISIALEDQYLIQVVDYKIRICIIQGELIREIDYEIDSIGNHNLVQQKSLKAILIKGTWKLQICKFKWN